MSVRDQVRAAWLKRFAENDKGADEEKPVKKAKKEVETQNVISLLSDDEDEVIIEKTSEMVKKVLKEPADNIITEKEHITVSKNEPILPPFKPLHNPTYDSHKLSNAITIKDIIGSPTIVRSFLFSYQYDLSFILPAYNNKNIPITILYQLGTVQDSPLRSHNVSLIKVDMQPFSSHHPKLIINIHNDDSLTIHMISANLTQTEFEYNNQFSWESPKLKKATSKETQFKKHLIEWLKSYEKPQLNSSLVKNLEKYDFTPIIGDLISSSSGNHQNFGYLSLENSLKGLNLLPTSYDSDTQILYQSSSIGAPYSSTKQGVANIFTHLLAPLIMNVNYPINNGSDSLKAFLNNTKTKLFCVFPSLKDVQNSRFGYDSGGWSHYNPTSKTGIPQQEILKDIFCHPYSKQRGTNTSHTKYIIVSKDNFKTIEWVLFTSANLSKTAWGNKRKQNGDVNISNYETGILISRKHYKSENIKLIPVTIGENKLLKDNEIAIELPFELPPKMYSKDDTPWVISQPCAEFDMNGRQHGGLEY